MKTKWAFAAIVCCIGLLSSPGFCWQDEEQQQAEEKSEVKGQIIVVGPDGERRVFEIPDTEGVFQLEELQDELGEFKLRRMALPENLKFNMPVVGGSEYYIGVSCTIAGDALRSHLELEEACLLVTGISEGSPAEEAGLQVNDIILSVGDSAMNNIAALSKAVEAAGKEESSLQLTIVRKGKQQSIEITPGKREKLSVPNVDIDNEKIKELIENAMKKRKIPEINMPNLKIDREKLRERMKSLPDFKDLKIPDDNFKRLEEKVEQLQKLIEEMQKDKNNDK